MKKDTVQVAIIKVNSVIVTEVNNNQHITITVIITQPMVVKTKVLANNSI